MIVPDQDRARRWLGRLGNSIMSRVWEMLVLKPDHMLRTRPPTLRKNRVKKIYRKYCKASCTSNRRERCLLVGEQVRPAPRGCSFLLCMRVLQAHTFGVLLILCPFPLCPQRPLERSAGIAFGTQCGSLKSKPDRDTPPVRNCPEDNKSTLCPTNKTLGSPASRGRQPQFPSRTPSCPSRPNSTRLPAVPRNAHTPFRLLTKALCHGWKRVSSCSSLDWGVSSLRLRRKRRFL